MKVGGMARGIVQSRRERQRQRGVLRELHGGDGYDLDKRRRICRKLEELIDGGRGNNFDDEVLPFRVKVVESRKGKTTQSKTGLLDQCLKIVKGQADGATFNAMQAQ
jgi:hypothetical protein